MYQQFDGKYAIRLKCYFLACVVVWRTLTFHCIQNKKAITKKTTLTHTNHKETQTNIVTCTLQAGRGCWTLVCCVPWSDSVCAMPAGFSLSKGAEVSDTVKSCEVFRLVKSETTWRRAIQRCACVCVCVYNCVCITCVRVCLFVHIHVCVCV